LASNNRHGERIGQMRHQGTWVQFTTSQNAYGEEIRTYSDLATVWFERMPSKTSDETETAARETAKRVEVFRMRYRSDVTEAMRFRWDSRLWNVKSILPDNYNEYMEVEVEHQIT